jgi:hypothetical protein
MKKKLFLALLLTITTYSLFAQKKSQLDIKTLKVKIDSSINKNISNEKKISEIELFIKKTVNLNKYLKKENDSLNKLLIHYRVKEDYYSTALGEQSNRFSLIIGSLLGFLALASFGTFRYELNRIIKKTDKQLNIQTKEFDNHKKNVLKLEKNLSTTAGNNYTTIALDFERKEEWVYALVYHLCSCREHYFATEIKYNEKSEEKEKSEIYKYVISNLNLARVCLNKIKLDDSLKNEVLEERNQFKRDLKKIDKIDYDEVQDIISEIRIGIRDYIK